MLFALTGQVPGLTFLANMQIKFLLGVFALASSTAGLLFAAQSISFPLSSLLLLAYPDLVPALPLLAIDTPTTLNGALKQVEVCGEHHHNPNDTTASTLTSAAGDTADTEGHRSHNHTLEGSEGAANETATGHHKHHHNCTATADGEQPSATNAVLNLGNAGADTGNATTTEHHHHHHNCSGTANEAQPSSNSALLDLGEEGAEIGNSSSQEHNHRHNCSAADAAVVTQTVLPLPFTSAPV